MRRLDQGGLNRASLFPGLDGFAQSLRTRMLLLSHLQKLEETAARTADNLGEELPSVITLNPAIRDQVKSGHREWPKT